MSTNKILVQHGYTVLSETGRDLATIVKTRNSLQKLRDAAEEAFPGSQGVDTLDAILNSYDATETTLNQAIKNLATLIDAFNG